MQLSIQQATAGGIVFGMPQARRLNLDQRRKSGERPSLSFGSLRTSCRHSQELSSQRTFRLPGRESLLVTGRFEAPPARPDVATNSLLMITWPSTARMPTREDDGFALWESNASGGGQVPQQGTPARDLKCQANVLHRLGRKACSRMQEALTARDGSMHRGRRVRSR
jgi:hypothetical protein